MDAATIRSCIAATLDPDTDVRRRAELQLKQVWFPFTCAFLASLPPSSLALAIHYVASPLLHDTNILSLEDGTPP